MRLSEFLNYFDFDYEVVDGQIRLIDLQGAYLGDIDQDRFDLTETGKRSLVDRLDAYINDSVLDDLEELLEDNGVQDVTDMDLGELVQSARDINLDYPYDLVDAILSPNLIEFEKDRIAESFSVGQVFFEKDTEKYIVLENLCKDSKDIWNFQVFDKNMEYLYNATVFDLRLADDIVSEVVQSVTHEKALRLDPHGMRFVHANNGTIKASLEVNDFLLERFSDIVDVPNRELGMVVAYYDANNDSVSFSIRVSDLVTEDGDYSEKTVEVLGTDMDKAMLLPQLKFSEPEFFAVRERPALDDVIQSCEFVNKKNDEVDIQNVRKTREER